MEQYKETPTPIDLPRQEKPAMDRKAALATLKEDIGVIRNLDEKGLIMLAKLLHFVVGKNTEKSKLEILGQFQQLLAGNHDPKKLQMVKQFIVSVAASKERPMDEGGAKLINEITDVVLESDEKKLIPALIEVTRAILKIFIVERPGEDLDGDARK
jgi:hypothetical protein